MKNTTKTFPKPLPWARLTSPRALRANAYTRKTVHWKEDFERELQDLLSDADAFITEKHLQKVNDIFQHPTNKKAAIHILDGKFTVMIDVKEVLGDG